MRNKYKYPVYGVKIHTNGTEKSTTKSFVEVESVWRGWRDGGQCDFKHRTIATLIQIDGNPVDWAWEIGVLL
jgi:hypothetical protein